MRESGRGGATSEAGSMHTVHAVDLRKRVGGGEVVRPDGVTAR
jgi:hypothetical protein